MVSHWNFQRVTLKVRLLISKYKRYLFQLDKLLFLVQIYLILVLLLANKIWISLSYSQSVVLKYIYYCGVKIWTGFGGKNALKGAFTIKASPQTFGKCLKTGYPLFFPSEGVYSLLFRTEKICQIIPHVPIFDTRNPYWLCPGQNFVYSSLFFSVNPN